MQQQIRSSYVRKRVVVTTEGASISVWESGFCRGQGLPLQGTTQLFQGAFLLMLLTLGTDDSCSEASSCPLAGDVGAVMGTLVQGQLRPRATHSAHHHLSYIPRVPVPGLLGI